MCMVAEERGQNAGAVGGMENTWSERRPNVQSSRRRKYGFEERGQNAGVLGGIEKHVVRTQTRYAIFEKKKICFLKNVVRMQVWWAE